VRLAQRLRESEATTNGKAQVPSFRSQLYLNLHPPERSNLHAWRTRESARNNQSRKVLRPCWGIQSIAL